MVSKLLDTCVVAAVATGFSLLRPDKVRPVVSDTGGVGGVTAVWRYLQVSPRLQVPFE